MVIRIDSPLWVPINSKKKFILNLNNYRNAYFRVLNTSKQVYKQYITTDIDREVYYKLSKIAIQYKIFKGDERRFDIGNIASIHQKFFEDALVESGHLPDDKATNIPLVFYSNGGVSRANPRVEITIYDLTSKADKKQLLDDFKEVANETTRH